MVSRIAKPGGAVVMNLGSTGLENLGRVGSSGCLTMVRTAILPLLRTLKTRTVFSAAIQTDP